MHANGGIVFSGDSAFGADAACARSCVPMCVSRVYVMCIAKLVAR